MHLHNPTAEGDHIHRITQSQRSRSHTPKGKIARPQATCVFNEAGILSLQAVPNVNLHTTTTYKHSATHKVVSENNTEFLTVPGRYQ